MWILEIQASGYYKNDSYFINCKITPFHCVINRSLSHKHKWFFDNSQVYSEWFYFRLYYSVLWHATPEESGMWQGVNGSHYSSTTGKHPVELKHRWSSFLWIMQFLNVKLNGGKKTVDWIKNSFVFFLAMSILLFPLAMCDDQKDLIALVLHRLVNNKSHHFTLLTSNTNKVLINSEPK